MSVRPIFNVIMDCLKKGDGDFDVIRILRTATKDLIQATDKGQVKLTSEAYREQPIYAAAGMSHTVASIGLWRTIHPVCLQSEQTVTQGESPEYPYLRMELIFYERKIRKAESVFYPCRKETDYDRRKEMRSVRFTVCMEACAEAVTA